jgi:enamine deaminase RidA (YjgF/YER057c/UK114 family)
LPPVPRPDTSITALNDATVHDTFEGDRWRGEHALPSSRLISGPTRPTDRFAPVFEAKLAELGLALPGPFPPHDPLDPVVVHGGTARTSGCLPRDADAKLHAEGILGRDVTLEVGVQCAALCAQNALSLLRAELGTLDAIERALTLTVFIACTDFFAEQPTVADGASRVLTAVFGDAGRHSRSAIGVAALPRGGPVEVELTVVLRSGAPA